MNKVFKPFVLMTLSGIIFTSANLYAENQPSDRDRTGPQYPSTNSSNQIINGRETPMSNSSEYPPTNQMSTQQTDYVMHTPKQLKWTAGPTGLPKGSQVSILEGDPNAEGPFTIRVKMPAKYRIPPHWHPIIEHVTVLSGKLHMGMGDVYDEKKAMTLPQNGFASIQPELHHYAFTREPTLIQLHGIGPWAITYVNPQDDPRNQNGT